MPLGTLYKNSPITNSELTYDNYSTLQSKYTMHAVMHYYLVLLSNIT